MNVLYLHCHDAGKHFSFYGKQVNTPHLQALAEQSTVFDNMFCVSPTCSPSRGSMLTGLYPTQNGLTGLAHYGFELADTHQHLAHHLSVNGIKTALFGIQHEIDDHQEKQEIGKLGYEIFDYGSSLPTDDRLVAQKASEFLSQPTTQPFFMSVGFFTPHRPFSSNEAMFTGQESPPRGLVTTRETQQDIGDFQRALEVMDINAGQVIQAAQSRGDTAIIFTTDHGIPFPKHKCNLYDKGCEVAFLCYLPHQVSRRVSSLTSHLDFVPTVCELLHCPTPPSVEGRSLLPLISGVTTEHHSDLFGQINFHVCRETVRSIRTKDYKLIVYLPNQSPPMLNTDYSLSKLAQYGAGMFEQQRDIELFDLNKDPDEEENLAHSPDYQEVAGQLLHRLHKHQQRIGDPALSGKIPINSKQRVVCNVEAMDIGSIPPAQLQWEE